MYAIPGVGQRGGLRRPAPGILVHFSARRSGFADRRWPINGSVLSGPARIKIHVFCQSTRFTGGRQVLFAHANALACRGHDVRIWISGEGPRSQVVPWMTLAVPLSRFDAKAWDLLPPADICLLERPHFANLCQANRGIPVHCCQGYEGTDAELRIACIRRHPWRFWKWFELRKLQRRLRLVEEATVPQPSRSSSILTSPS